MENNHEPLLSICIPTYNRASYLRQALDSYVHNKAFDNQVEIVISDNASTDDTESVCRHYIDAFPNIHYYRNSHNVVVENFSLVLDRANGKYLKLMNDNLLISENGLLYLKERVQKHVNDRVPLFFTNGDIFNRELDDYAVCRNFDEAIMSMSYLVTAIMIFGCWNDDWRNVKNRLKYTETLLSQDDWVYQILENRGVSAIYTGKYCNYLPLDNKNRTGYNWFKIHIENYYELLQPYISKGLVSKKTLSKERRSYLKNLHTQLVMAYLYNIMPDWHFDMSGATRIMWRYFKKEPLYHIMMLSFPIWGPYKVIKYFIRKKS